MRFRRLALPAVIRAAGLLAAAVLLATAGLGCSSAHSYIVLLLESSSAPIANIAQVTVVVSQGTTEMETLTYPASNLAAIDNSDGNVDGQMGTLSVSFSGNQAGDIKFVVTALDARGCAIGTGDALISIIKGATNEGIVFLMPEEKCTGDAGAPDRSPDSSFPGCDPNSLSCPATESCQIDCQGSSNVCAVAGTNAAGGTCTRTTGCAAGSQCFDYGGLGCDGTQVCLPFCATDADCAAFGAGGLGPGSFCRDPVACGGVTTAYHTCTFSCDPTAAAATAAHTGCPAGLACVIPSSMDHVDCSCPEATRTAKENTPCTSTTQCAPGLLCQQTCRAVCRCDASNGVCTAPNDCPTSGTTCTFVPNQTRYGVCR
jgi:hypothetical protein